MNLNTNCLHVTTEDKTQLEAALPFLASFAAGGKSPEQSFGWTPASQDPEAGAGKTAALSLDAGYFSPAEWKQLAEQIRESGVFCGLRLPHIWRQEAEAFFRQNLGRLKAAGFDFFLCRNPESVCFLEEEGLLENAGYLLDHSIYITNTLAWKMLEEMLPARKPESFCLSLELNETELKELISEIPMPAELTVYGRAPMMVSAQCVQKSARGCSHSPQLLYLRDRTRALMPVKNCCAFCYSTIYNAVPTVLWDVAKDLGAAVLRYEFTTETAEETRRILRGETMAQGTFTRGHFRRSVQ